MSFWVIIQVALNIGLIGLGLVVWARVSRPQKDDPRMSRGLQLLQSKIAILEDLSDRTDHQVKQMTQYLDEKAKEIEVKVTEVQDHILKVDVSIQKSLEVSKIFQDKIPHKEIIERQNTLKYIQAARLAHQGMTVDQIAQKVDIPTSELEFIVKVNKNKLVFSEEHLPDWAQGSLETLSSEDVNSPYAEPVLKPTLARNINWSFENSGNNVENQMIESQKVQDEFKKAVAQADQVEVAPIATPEMTPDFGIESALETNIETHDLKSSIQKARDLINKTLDKTFESEPAASSEKKATNASLGSVIKKERAEIAKPYQFKRIDTL